MRCCFTQVRVQVRVEDVEDKGDVAAHLDAPQATAAALLGREARQRERDARARRRLSTAEEQQVLVQSAEQASDALLPAAEPRAQWLSLPPDGRQRRERRFDRARRRGGAA